MGTKSSVTSFVTVWSEYFASFSMALECDTAKTVSDYVKTIHDTANTPRIGAVKSAGTPLAKKIEDGTIPESMMEASGLQSVMERLGLIGGEVPEIKKETEDAQVTEVEKNVTEDAKVAEETVKEKIVEVETPTEEPAVAVSVIKKTSSKKSKRGSKESTPVADLM